MLFAVKLNKLGARCRKTWFPRGLFASIVRIHLMRHGKTHDSIYSQTRYEAHPYPRWDNIYDCIRSTKVCAVPPKLVQATATQRSPTPADSERILVAGCGTGRFSLQLAASRPSARFVLLDQVGVSLICVFSLGASGGSGLFRHNAQR